MTTAQLSDVTFYLPDAWGIKATVEEVGDHMTVYLPRTSPKARLDFKFGLMKVFSALAHGDKSDSEANVSILNMKFLHRIRSLRIVDRDHVPGRSCQNLSYGGHFV